MRNERTKTINFTNRWTVINGKQTSRVQRWKMFIEITWKLFSRIIFQRVSLLGQSSGTRNLYGIVQSCCGIGIFRGVLPLFGKHGRHNATRVTRMQDNSVDARPVNKRWWKPSKYKRYFAEGIYEGRTEEENWIKVVLHENSLVIKCYSIRRDEKLGSTFTMLPDNRVFLFFNSEIFNLYSQSLFFLVR